MNDARSARDRSQPGDLSPIWRLVGLEPGDQDPARGTPTVVTIPDAERPWSGTVDSALRRLDDGSERVVVVVEGRWSRALLSLLAHRRWRLRSAPSLRDVRRAIADHATTEIAATYVLWPSGRTPRIAFPRGKGRLVAWAQRSGVLGGGGNRLWARRLARSFLFRPLAVLIAPAVALVVRRVGGSDA